MTISRSHASRKKKRAYLSLHDQLRMVEQLEWRYNVQLLEGKKVTQ